jgi:hypothetical protein
LAPASERARYALIPSGCDTARSASGTHRGIAMPAAAGARPAAARNVSDTAFGV